MEGQVYVSRCESEAVGPAGAAWEDVLGLLTTGESWWEELSERLAADAFPGLVDVAVLVDEDSAGGLQLDQSACAGAPSDLEDAGLGEDDDVDAAVAECAGGVAHTAPAGLRATSPEGAAFLRRAATARADAAPHGLACTAGERAVAEALVHGEQPELLAGEVNERAHYRNHLELSRCAIATSVARARRSCDLASASSAAISRAISSDVSTSLLPAPSAAPPQLLRSALA